MYCDADSNNFEANDTPAKPKKKKKPKNQPFEGHGIGYHQGKTVVIKLPTSESIKLPDVSTIHSFDYFSKTPQAVPSPQAEVSLYGEVAYPYHAPNHVTEYKMQDTGDTPDEDAIVVLNMETPQQSDEIASIEERNKQIAHWGTPSYSTADAEQNNPTSDHNDEGLAEVYDRFAKTVKQKVYPESRDFAFKINKDYSEFYDPPNYKGSDTIKDLDERFGKTNNVPTHIQARKPVRITQDRYQNERDGHRKMELTRHRKEYEDTDSSYRTSLPIRKPYSAYEQTETPKYANREYLKDRHNYSHLYSPRVNDEQTRQGPHTAFQGEPLTEDEWYKKDSLKQSPAVYNTRSYTDDERMEHKSNDHSRRPSSAEYEDSTEPPKKSQAYISGEYYGEGAESPEKSQEYTSDEYDDENSTESPEKSQAYSLFGVPVPLTHSWYKPSHSNPEDTQSYSDEVSASHEDR
ncbi:Metalloendopeptidase [Operophtera brumata]|uniref:Metalloendopeptidase n=1 Tax=Operophtera brumata TaxID=104452 RepID=A0A0L7LKA3_OPEBR|nr:Metalloendopeptidase [Operophtera brumata]